MGALVAAGYQVYAVNPLAVSRYRDRHTVSGAKSDAGDAKVLADLVEPTATTTARSLATASWPRRSRSWPAPTRAWSGPANGRSTSSAACSESSTRAPAAFGGDLSGRDALAVLAVAPTPTLGRGLSRAKLAAVLRRAGRQRGADAQAVKLQAALRAPQLATSPVVAEAYGAAVTALAGVVTALNLQLEQVSGQLDHRF